MAVPVQLEIFMKDLTKAGLQSVGKNVDDVENQTQKLIDALKLVRAEQIKQLEANKQAGKSYTQEAANVQALTGQINGLKAGLKDLQKTKEEVAKTPSIDIDTEAVTRKTNNLKMQFSQVARELPSLAMGPQMFILAISNNLPMLADAIADVRKQNELLAYAGRCHCRCAQAERTSGRIRTKRCAGMETAGKFNIQLADGTCGRHIAGYCVWKRNW